MKRPLRVLVWSSIPTHHQSAFFGALRRRDIDLVVHYFQRVEAERATMGWAPDPALPQGERYVDGALGAVDLCADWRERIHIVPGYGSAFLMRLAWFLSRRRAPWLHWSEHSWPSLRSPLTFAVKRAYGSLVRRYAIGALAIGELARREFIRWGVAGDRIRFLPYAVTGFGSPPGGARPVGGTRFLFVGQLARHKGIDLLLAAMRDVLATHPDARLVLAGADRSAGTYAREAAGLGIAPAVEFAGTIPAAEIGGVLHRCDVLVLPSRHDGWGVVLNEAASAGKALIASDACGAAWHLVSPGVNGLRFPAGDAPALARAMLTYCREPDLARRHGTESLRLFEEFTPDRNALRFEESLDSLLEPEPRTGILAAATRRAS